MLTIPAKRGRSPYYLAYTSLSEAQKKRRKRALSLEEVLVKLESTPGLLFPRGTTTYDVICTLQGWQLLKIRGQKIWVLPKHSSFGSTNHRQQKANNVNVAI